MTDHTTETAEPDNPAAHALAKHIADHPVSTIQAAFRYLNAPLTIELVEGPPSVGGVALRDRIAGTSCVCGESETPSVRHRSDGPCYVVDDRLRIAALAIARAEAWKWADGEPLEGKPEWQTYLAYADAVLAVLSAPADRAAEEHRALKRAHVALAEQAARDQSAVARVRRLHDALDAETGLTSPDQEINTGTETPTVADVQQMLARMRVDATTHDLDHLLRLVADWYRSSEGRDVLVDELIAAGYRLPDGEASRG